MQIFTKLKNLQAITICDSFLSSFKNLCQFLGHLSSVPQVPQAEKRDLIESHFFEINPTKVK
jgi:hypothetical protein